jgi:hypothetical protein
MKRLCNNLVFWFQSPRCVIHAGAMKRASMNVDDVNTLSNTTDVNPMPLLALWKHSANAIEIMKALIDHGACPTVMSFEPMGNI